MEAAFLSQLVAFESAPATMESMPLRPAKSLTKTYPAVPQRDTTSIELERIFRPATHTGAAGTGTGTGGTVSPITTNGGFRSGTITPNDLEMSSPSVVMGHDDGVEALQSSTHAPLLSSEVSIYGGFFFFSNSPTSLRPCKDERKAAG